MLDETQRIALLRIARDAVTRFLRGDSPADAEASFAIADFSPGVFVSLHLGPDLRGCIGVIASRSPLHEMVASLAVSAATEDPRFDPVRIEELASLRFEISLLSPPRPIFHAREIVVGRDGVIVGSGVRGALLLPQVAASQGWTAEQLLSAACRKAGLPPSAWSGGAVELQAFTAEVFGEEREPHPPAEGAL